MGGSSSKLSHEQLSELKTKTHFDKNELLERYKIFLKDCPSGELNKPTLIKIYQEVFPFGDPHDYADYIFRVFDENHNDIIDFREFVCALSVTSRGTLKEKLEWAFHLYDIDGNGTISYNELLQIVRSIYKMTGSMVDLSPDEDTPEYWANKIFGIMDRDKNQKITIEELVEGSQQDPTILQALTISAI